MHGITVICAFLLFAAVRGDAPCADLDTSACQLMATQRADLCSDPVLAQSACPKFCNLCPIQCFHCNGTVNSLEDCTAQKQCAYAIQCFHCNGTVNSLEECTARQQCADGEVCMRKTMISYVDGHKAFQLSCESKQHCDGSDLHLTLGKRDHVQSRNVLITCCGTDLCNGAPSTTIEPPTTPVPATNAPVTYAPTTKKPTTHAPTTTPTPACRKDVIIMIDDAHPELHESASDVKHFLSSLASKLHIGVNNVLVSVATYTSSAKQHWDLNDHTTSSNLNNAISSLSLMHASDHDDSIATAINYLLHHKYDSDNRVDADDVVIIIAAHDTSHHVGHHDPSTSSVPAQFHHEYPEVIAIGYHHVPDQILHEVATSSSHVFDLTHTSGLSNVVSQVASMICPKHRSSSLDSLNKWLNGLIG